MLVDYLCQDSCSVLNLFFDWNPIYSDDYVHDLGTDNHLYQRKTPEELNPFAKL